MAAPIDWKATHARKKARSLGLESDMSDAETLAANRVMETTRQRHADEAAISLLASMEEYYQPVKHAVHSFADALLQMRRADPSNIELTMLGVARFLREMKALSETVNAQRKLASAHMANVMMGTGNTTIRHPQFTAYMGEPARVAIITDESALPEDVWTNPHPDRQEIATRLRRGEKIDGAVLANGGPPFLAFRDRQAESSQKIDKEDAA